MREKIFCVSQRKFPIVFWKNSFSRGSCLLLICCWCQEDAGSISSCGQGVLEERKWAWKRTWVQRVSEPLSDKVVLGDSYIVHGALSRRLFSGIQTSSDISSKCYDAYYFLIETISKGLALVGEVGEDTPVVLPPMIFLHSFPSPGASWGLRVSRHYKLQIPEVPTRNASWIPPIFLPLDPSKGSPEPSFWKWWLRKGDATQ